MIKRIKILATGALLLAGLGACSPSGKKTGADSTVDTLRTAETVNLLNNLRKVPTQGIMFGHHDDPLYGVGWEGDEDRSDVKSVCGDYPAVMSFDLGHIELEREKSLDNVPFRKIRQETINQYKRGGVVSFSWHLDNPLTGKDAWDVSDTTVVASILTEEQLQQKENYLLMRGFMRTPEDDIVFRCLNRYADIYQGYEKGDDFWVNTQHSDNS